MTGILFALVAMVAAGVWIWRGARARAERRLLHEGPGTTPDQAIAVSSFEDIDLTVAGRACSCGTGLRLTGEGSRQDGERRLRVTRMVCDECEEVFTLYFDLTEIRH